MTSGFASLADILRQQQQEQAEQRTQRSVRLVVDGSPMAIGHVAETDYERECAEYDASRTGNDYIFVNNDAPWRRMQMVWQEDMMKKNADNTPTFVKGERVKVAGQQGEVIGTLEDGRVSVKFGGGQSQPIEPDKVERE